jgi:hypothetical protein
MLGVVAPFPPQVKRHVPSNLNVRIRQPETRHSVVPENHAGTIIVSLLLSMLVVRA